MKKTHSRRSKQRHAKAEVEADLRFIREGGCNSEVECSKNQDESLELIVANQECSVASIHSIYDSEDEISFSSDSDSSSCVINNTPHGIFENTSEPISQFLCRWGLEHNITHNALRDLLNHLKTYSEFSLLPKDPRTLLSTPKACPKVSLSGGDCIYFDICTSIQSKLLKGFKKCEFPVINRLKQELGDMLVTIAVGIDGIPITKSTNKQFWPVLCSVDQAVDQVPFVAALYFGNTKPSDTDFLKPFVETCKMLEEHGILFNNIKYEFRISRILADAPARSFIKGVRNHNSYEGCERCSQVGRWHGRVVYPFNPSFDARTDNDFNDALDSCRHFTSKSVLNELRIGLVSQVPLDYLHLVCLGVVRKLLRQWVKGKLPHRVKGADINLISERFIKFKKYFPRCFQRRPRALEEINHFKGSEFRSILLYTGVAAFYKILPKSQYAQFLLLHVAFYILLSARGSEDYWNSIAKKLLYRFVQTSEKLYGSEFISYNVHGLLHICDDSLNFGTLENASTFQFESYMQQIKRLLRSNNMHLEQAYKRICEMNAVSNATESESNIELKMSDRIGENCYLLNTGEIILAKSVKKFNDKLQISVYQKFLDLRSVKEYPIDSKELGIYYASNLSNEFNQTLCSSDIVLKYVCLPFKKSYLCLPLLHTCK